MPRFDFKDPLNPRLAVKPQVWQTPFIRLANRIPPSYRIHFVGVTVDCRLGYTGRRQINSIPVCQICFFVMFNMDSCDH